MATTEDFVFKLEIVPGRSPKVESVTRALEAWADVIRTAAEIAEPESVASVELVGVEDGSDVFRIALRKMQNFGQAVADGAEEYPVATKVAVALSGMITTGLIAVGLQVAIVPDPRIPVDQMAVFKRTNELLAESNELQRKNMQFYGIVQDEPAFESVKVLNGGDRAQLYEVPRTEFATRAGLWDEATPTEQPVPETRTATWDVTLLKPVLVAQPRRWMFAKDGLTFSALMSDKRVLEAIHDKTLPIQVAEGIAMKVEIQYKEYFDGQAWIPMDRTRKVIRVLHPLPPISAGPLFLDTGPP